METKPFIITLQFDDATFSRLDCLRSAHFPAALNQLSAHLTLFHHLPGDQPARVITQVRAAAATRAPFEVHITRPRSLGRGVALEVDAPDLIEIRGRLAAMFRDDLTRQDGQGFRPHVTIQNKVSATEARALLDDLARGFTPWSGTATGLLVWRYLGGPWRLECEAPFSQAIC